MVSKDVKVFEDVDDESGCLEPFFFDEAEVLAEAAADEERRQRKEDEKARINEEIDRRLKANQEVINKIREYDEKRGRVCYTRFFMKDFSTFDIDAESLLGPMRYTDRTPTSFTNILGEKEEYRMSNSANILSVNIVSLDVGFPLHVYGHVIARDSLDRKCVYLFRRGRENCQFINSKDQSLILTGPSRGLVLGDSIYFEVDLLIRDDQKQKDPVLSKGLLDIDGILIGSKNRIEAETETLESRLSTVELKYAPVGNAVEATLEIKVLKGDFYGKITACTTTIQDKLVLHDSKAGDVMTSDGGIIKLQRPVVAVSVWETLILTIDDATTHYHQIRDFAPRLNGAEEAEITIGGSLIYNNAQSQGEEQDDGGNSCQGDTGDATRTGTLSLPLQGAETPMHEVPGDDLQEITNLKQYLAREFEVKDLGHLRFIGRQEINIWVLCICRRKSCLMA